MNSDKSISQRCFIIGSICEGISIVENILESEDILSTIKCLKKLNCKIERLEKGNIKYTEKDLGVIFVIKIRYWILEIPALLPDF